MAKVLYLNMSSILPRYEYDIFISYRQKDNKGGHWVTDFVDALKTELEATFKEDISIYFDESPHDGLLESHTVDKSLEGKLKCLILIPIISRTYCDPGSFAWQHEFIAFRDLAKKDEFGLDVKLPDGNVASRILPIQIHELSPEDQRLFEKENGGPLRAIPFIFKSLGVNRPLTPADSRSESSNKTLYRDQINKTANALDEIIRALQNGNQIIPAQPKTGGTQQIPARTGNWLWSELVRRNVFRASFVYIVVALALHQMVIILDRFIELPGQVPIFLDWILIALFPLAIILAWLYESSPHPQRSEALSRRCSWLARSGRKTGRCADQPVAASPPNRGNLLRSVRLSLQENPAHGRLEGHQRSLRICCANCNR